MRVNIRSDNGLEFVAHALIGGPTAAAYGSSSDLFLGEPMPWFEVGRLYVAVAGLLNIVAICDALGCVLAHNVRAEDRRALRERIRTQHGEAVARVEAAREAPLDIPLGAEPRRQDVERDDDGWPA